MMTSRLVFRGLAAGAILASCAFAQIADPKERGGTPVPRIGRKIPDNVREKLPPAPGSFGVYHQHTSRAIFRACDRDGNDRILAREAKEAFKAFDLEEFRAFDTNSDGRIEFDEFDKRFKEITRYGGEITLTEVARKRLPLRLGEESGYPNVLVTWFANLDVDANDKLGRDEFKTLAKLLPAEKFQQLDKNLDDGLTIDEMRPLIDFITLIEKQRPRKGATQRPLPIDFRGADLDGDSLIDQSELERALFRIDPTLPAHARSILQSADQNADLFLDRFEVEDAQNRAMRDARKALPKSLRNMKPAELKKLLEKIGGGRKTPVSK